MNLRAVILALAISGCARAPAPALSDSSAVANSPSPAASVLSSTAEVQTSVAAQDTSPSISDVPAVSEMSPVAQNSDPSLLVLRNELMIPVAGVVAGELRDTFTDARSNGRVHDAIDIPAPRNTPVLSATNGRVLKLFTSKAGGLMVYAADSSERFILLYAHLDAYAPGLADGARLTRGQTIGFVGTTGNAPPNLPHLHFGIDRAVDVSRWWQGTPVNPYPLLKTR